MAQTVTGPPEPKETGTFQPYIPASQSPLEFTLKAVILGAVFGLIFGASTVYLGLRAGLTVSASIPIAVLAISVLKKLGGSTILENNIVQTIGSAGESIAGGVVFTVPALLFLLPDGPGYFNYLQITMLTFAGGILGVLMMVPLRRALIVKEHGILPYPEGTACAEVLVAGERGGKLASLVFGGLWVGALWKSLSWIFNLFLQVIGYSTPRTSQFPNATLNIDISPEYLGVGYVIGPRIAGIMFAGGVLSWLVLLPLLSILGEFITVPFPPIHPNFANNPLTGRPFLISEMAPAQLWSAYIRYIGAGAVLASGLITLARTLPTIVSSARGSFKDLTAGAAGASQLRTERDIPMVFVLGGSLLLGLFLAFSPGLPMQGNVLAAVLILIFGFFFATVSSRITGLIGTSSNPISGMTIATLILTCLLFVGLGWTGDMYAPIALCVGAIVCIAAANAGNTSQDLKTGYILGATPLYQQIGLVIGVLTSALVIGLTLLYLHRNLGGIGSANLAAPQATLMSTIIKGLLNQNLPWGLVLVGVFVAIVLELCGIRSLSFAVGSYLPIATTAPIFAGGLVRWWVERKTGQSEESDISSGTLFSSGLIAGGSIAGILFALLVGTNDWAKEHWGFGTIDAPQMLGTWFPFFSQATPLGQIASLGLFVALAVIVVRMGMRKVNDRVTRLALKVLPIVLLAASSAAPQTSTRRITTIDALKQYPGYYHLQNVLLRGELAEAERRMQLKADDLTVRVLLDDGVSSKNGTVEIRGVLIDVGRLEPGDPRVGGFAEGRDADRWPHPGEELFIKVNAVSNVPAEATTSSIRAIALEPWKFESKTVTVTGNFRGRNLFGDLPGAPGKSKYDFVLRGGEGAIWVTNLRPRGNGFELDINRRVDSDRWLEITGTIVRERGLVSLDGTKLALAKAPAVIEAPAESAAPPVPLEPVQVVFSSPTDGETEVTANSAIRIQFSRGLNEPSLVGHVRVSYVGIPTSSAGGADSGLKFQATYDAPNRAIQLRMAQPFEAFRTVKIELLDGLKGFDGASVTPWTMTFSVGG